MELPRLSRGKQSGLQGPSFVLASVPNASDCQLTYSLQLTAVLPDWEPGTGNRQPTLALIRLQKGKWQPRPPCIFISSLASIGAIPCRSVTTSNLCEAKSVFRGPWIVRDKQTEKKRVRERERAKAVRGEQTRESGGGGKIRVKDDRPLAKLSTLSINSFA